MRTPWDIARLAASALAASPGLQGFCAERFGQALAVYLGGAGTDFENLPRPFAVISLAGATDGAKAADTVDLSVAVGIDSCIDPESGTDADLSKPFPLPDGVRLVGRGPDIVLLAGLAADEAGDALPDCVVEKRSFRYLAGTTPLEAAVAVLTIAPGIGFWNGDDASLHFHHHPQQET